MICTPTTKWKYLRETSSKYFNPSRNTTLQEYLEAIYPGIEFEYQSSIKKNELPENTEPKRYVCDAISKDLHLVVEFDGLNHYNDTQICLNDIKRDEWFKSLNYRTIRIPYWIQLSKDVIETLFDIVVTQEFCQLDYSFYDPEHNRVNFNILPGNMCELGRRRFIREFNNFNLETRLQVYNDIMKCIGAVDYDQLLSQAILPHDVYMQLNL